MSAIPVEASWRIVGVCVERRELTSEKNASWRGYVCKLASMGGSFEVELTPKQFTTVGEGEAYDACGRFDPRATKTGGTRVIFVAQSIKPLAGAKP